MVGSCRIFLVAFSTSLEGQTTLSLSIYATSSFSKHSMLATVFVVQGIINGMASRMYCSS